jgi:hypothetical protein
MPKGARQRPRVLIKYEINMGKHSKPPAGTKLGQDHLEVKAAADCVESDKLPLLTPMEMTKR